MRSRFTSRSSAIASGSTSAISTTMAIRSLSNCRPAAVQQVGFDEQDSLFPIDNRVFRGSELLREYFTFPRKFLGFKLTRLREIMPKLRSKSIDIVFAFDEQNSRLAAAVEPKTFSLYTAPAINLFEKSTDRIAIAPNAHEYHVVPDRSRYLDYEPHRVVEVFAHFPGAKDKVPVRPLYSASVDPTASSVESTLLHGPPASAAANRRRESPWRDLGLCRDGHVHLPARAGRAERREVGSRTECSRLVFQPSSHGTFAGRAGRRGLSSA